MQPIQGAQRDGEGSYTGEPKDVNFITDGGPQHVM